MVSWSALKRHVVECIIFAFAYLYVCAWSHGPHSKDMWKFYISKSEHGLMVRSQKTCDNSINADLNMVSWSALERHVVECILFAFAHLYVRAWSHGRHAKYMWSFYKCKSKHGLMVRT
jgi:hypothetical protein